MTESRVDFAVLGATTQARLVAGMLASAHGKTVIFKGESQAGYRLSRGIDLSVGAITRPETWALLKACVPETTKLIGRIGKRSWTRLDPIFFAEGAAGREALSHIRYMASAFGIAAERVPSNLLGNGRDGLMLRDAVQLRSAVLEPALDRWLDSHKVRRVDGDTVVTVRPDGSAECTIGEERIEIGQTILADDVALLAHLPTSGWPALLERQVASTILTEPTEPIAAPIMHQLDSGTVLTQHGDRGIVAFGPGAVGEFSATLGTLLGRERAIRQAGQSSYTRFLTSDRAPAVGRIGGTGPDVLAGFGSIGAYLAPAIARWLCGAASASENAWLGARLIDRSGTASPVSDVGDQR
ncbi:hypothetical protein [Devosia sp. SL43]|uniref:hypothetical protein n=1 Tax=Devosia sp. SL43 TaxID=2806348 RepID=UPI001F28F8E5|nr:hypothetical protein [Devosia sp. SL43]UJW85533.1 hypothetical protein IM737_19405 [Devosia sp. SL43]